VPEAEWRRDLEGGDLAARVKALLDRP